MSEIFKNNEVARRSDIDGSVEMVHFSQKAPQRHDLKPVYEEKMVERAGFDGVEEVLIRVLVGYAVDITQAGNDTEVTHE